MQETNKTLKRPLKSGDGTVHEREKTHEANWFGTSHEPQEEFSEQDNQAPITSEQKDDPHAEKADRAKMSEGKPSI
jgi:hypothetical protein